MRAANLLRIGLVSDLHLSVGGMPFPHGGADLLVLAGDIARPTRALDWAKAAKVPTLYVAGNHEFYGSDLASTFVQLRSLAEGTEVIVLERQQWDYRGVRFLGCTLWSDFRLFDGAEARAESVAKVKEFTRDFSHIKLAPDFDDPFTPAACQLQFLQSVDWLEESFSRPWPGPTVVITHFAPSEKSVSPQYEGSPINTGFVSKLDSHIARWRPALWLHGHTHDAFDYRIGETRVVCNAHGYAKAGVPENPRFDPAYVIDLPLPG